MNARPMPPAEVTISLELVRRLLADQTPDLADRPLRMLAHGWDNVMVRLGNDLIVRLPRRSAAVELLHHEQRWLPDLAARLPMPTPAPVRIGCGGFGYPWPWSVVPHLPGDIAARTPPADYDQAAAILAGFLTALHVPAPADAPRSRLRGIPLADRATLLATGIQLLGSTVDGKAITQLFRAATAAPAWVGPPVWLHGDLHPANLLVDGGRISGVIDFGDITAGDPATDLAIAWMLLPAASRGTFRDAYAAESPYSVDALWIRARGWALVLSVAFLAHSADDPLIAAIGRRTLQAVLADA